MTYRILYAGSENWDIALGYLLGYAFSLEVGNFFVKGVLDAAHPLLGVPDESHRRSRWFAQAAGLMERCLYTTSWLAGKPEFVGVWLVLKVAGEWKGWTEENRKEGHPRSLFNTFMIGTGLSLLYGVTGAKLIEWLGRCEMRKAVWVPLLLVAGSVSLWLWARITNWLDPNSPREDRP